MREKSQEKNVKPVFQENIKEFFQMNAQLQFAAEMLSKQREEYRKIPPLGKRISIDGVDCILHLPEETKTKLPLFIELHGGAWVGGDAVFVDSLCQKISREAPCIAVNLNYKKLDVHPFPYPMQEVCTVISHFIKNSGLYGADPERIIICGQSAGAHIAAGAAVLAKEKGLPIARQILVYPFLDWTGKLPNPMKNQIDSATLAEIHNLFFGDLDPSAPYLSPAAAQESDLSGVAPADIIVCGKDLLKPHGEAYFQKLRQAGQSATLKEYESALHGFLEVNRPDFISPNEAKGEHQAALARDCEKYIIDIVRKV